MDLRKIKKLIDLLEESNLAEIEIKEGEESVRLSRIPQGVAVAAPAAALEVRSPAAAPSELSARNGDDLYACLAQQGVRIGVPIIGEDHAWRGADQVRAAVPLGSLTHVGRAAGLDDTHLRNAERLAHHFDECSPVLV